MDAANNVAETAKNNYEEATADTIQSKTEKLISLTAQLGEV